MPGTQQRKHDDELGHRSKRCVEQSSNFWTRAKRKFLGRFAQKARQRNEGKECGDKYDCRTEPQRARENSYGREQQQDSSKHAA